MGSKVDNKTPGSARLTSEIKKCTGDAGLPKYVFVLSLENRSFDNLFGRSGIAGWLATDRSKKVGVEGVFKPFTMTIDPQWSNVAPDGTSYSVADAGDAPFIMPCDPKHEFEHIICQVYGPDAMKAMIKARAGAPPGMTYVETPSDDPKVLVKQAYPGILPLPNQSGSNASGSYTLGTPNNSGFVYSYVKSYNNNSTTRGATTPTFPDKVPAKDPNVPGSGPDAVMACFDTPKQLPVLNALASNYVICDNFFASLPGPTGPNRFFMMAGSSAGYDGGPTGNDIPEWSVGHGPGSAFTHGHLPLTNSGGGPGDSIFNMLAARKVPFRVFGGDNFPMAAVCDGVDATNTFDISGGLPGCSLFSEIDKVDDQHPFPYNFCWIEPDFDVASSLGPSITGHPMYSTGNSMHPCSDVRKAEQLIYDLYNKISGKPQIWNNCVIFITWDEHGAFYDHVPPPTCPPPGDRPALGRTWAFDFKRLGIRVPCLIISPLIPNNLVDKRQYDHTSILKTVIDLYNNGAFAADGKPPSWTMEAWTDRIKAAATMFSLFTKKATTSAQPTALATPLEPDAPPAAGGAGPANDQPPSGNTPVFLAAAANLYQSANPSVSPTTVNTNSAAADYFNQAAAAVDSAQANQKSAA